MQVRLHIFLNSAPERGECLDMITLRLVLRCCQQLTAGEALLPSVLPGQWSEPPIVQVYWRRPLTSLSTDRRYACKMKVTKRRTWEGDKGNVLKLQQHKTLNCELLGFRGGASETHTHTHTQHTHAQHTHTTHTHTQHTHTTQFSEFNSWRNILP